jgi:hypothetical protein
MRSLNGCSIFRDNNPAEADSKRGCNDGRKKDQVKSRVRRGFRRNLSALSAVLAPCKNVTPLPETRMGAILPPILILGLEDALMRRSR